MHLKNTKLRRITSTELLTLITIEQYSNNNMTITNNE